MSHDRGPDQPFEDVVEGLRREGLLEPPPTVGETDEVSEGTGRVTLSFAPADRSVRVPPGVSVFDAASWNGIAIDSTCGGHGTCRKCLVRLTEAVSPVTRHDRRTFTDEQLAEGWRLACLVRATHDLAVEVPPLVTRPKASTVGVGRQVILRPAVQKRYVELGEPTLADQRTDLARLRDAVDDLTLVPDLHALRRLPTVLRQSDFKVTAVVVDEALVDVEPGDTTGQRHAIAFDLGTTTVVATLLDLETGTPVAVASILNKQQPFGGDVITRISATMMDPEALPRLTALARETLAELAAEVCAEGGIDPAAVYEVALAGNATMTALLLGVDPEPLGVAPFIQVSADWPVLLASDLGLSVHPGARAVVFPALGAYVGGDIVAGMLASGLDRDKRVRLFVDVGTNCEIALTDGDRIVTTAAPAGPAFEGGAIRCGMRAADGAIEVIRLDPVAEAPSAAVTLGVIGDVEPRGLCGSGLVDAVAELARVGLLDTSGRFVPEETAAGIAPALADRLTTVRDGERVFVLHRSTPDAPAAESVYLSQRDVRELQFAKAAISTGWTLLLEELGLEASEVQQVLLAGSFGSYLSPASAVRIGLVPKLSVLRIVSAGNVAGEGAKMVLLSARERTGADTLLEEVAYVELSDRPDFNDRFVDQLAFPAERGTPGRVALVACGALARPAAESVGRNGWPVDVHPLNPLLHNRPERIAPEVEELVLTLRERYDRVAVGYADCGTYGALDEVCERLGVDRLPGLHCYDLFAGPAEVAALSEAEPGTYLLTDFLVRSFSRTVVHELGLDRHPELRDDYFRHYTRVVWLVQTTDAAELAELRTLAQDAAARIGLPLEVRATGAGGLERALADLVSTTR